MIDLAEVRKEFPNLTSITAFASGGQKEVCRAEHQGNNVVLKFILPMAGAEERAIRELEAVRTLNSQYVPAVLEAGKRSLGGCERLYIIEPFIDGETYRIILNRQPVQSLRAVLELMKVLLLAAVDFELKKLVHRDIKPANIMVDRTGKIWILDFGIARHLDLSSLTPTGGYGVGTIGYAPPEQYRNLKPEIDARADLFSIGMVAHESLTGKHFYWDGAPDQMAVIHKMDKQCPPRLVIPADPTNEFSEFIATLCQCYPSRRPQTAAEAAAWFMPIYNRLSTTPTP